MAAFPRVPFSSSVMSCAAWRFVNVSGRIFTIVPCQNSSVAVKVTELLTLPAAESHNVPLMTVASYAVLLVRGIGNNCALSTGDRTARCS
jgi:hypothetical protein